MKRIEPLLWAAMIAIFGGLVLIEGRSLAALQAEIGLSPDDLYRSLANDETPPQIVDVRDAESYLEAHIPGAIPYPDCVHASQWMIRSVPTVIVSSEGDAIIFGRCRAQFTAARNLAGGMTAWSDEGHPEDEGEHAPPKSSAGGGCL